MSTPVQPGVKAPKKVVDWEAVEVHYRANIRSLKDIGAEYGVSDAGIIKRAKRDGWARDLGAKIKAKAEAKVSAAAVSAVVSAQTRVAEVQIVEANAQLQADIRLSHRTDIQRSRKLTMALLEELEFATDNRELLSELGELMFQPDDNGKDKRNELLEKVISLAGRSTTMKTLAESLKTLVGLERQAFGIDDKEADKGSLEDWLAKLGD